MNFMEYSLSKFKNDIANQFGQNVFYNNVLIRVFYYLLKKRINTRILFLMITYRRVLRKMSLKLTHLIAKDYLSNHQCILLKFSRLVQHIDCNKRCKYFLGILNSLQVVDYFTYKY